MGNPQSLSPLALFTELFSARDVFHLTHLRQLDGKYATHIALQDAYEQILPLIDGLVEKWFALYGVHDFPIKPSNPSEDILSYTQDLMFTIEYSKQNFTWGMFRSILEDIQEVVGTLIYKLKHVT